MPRRSIRDRERAAQPQQPVLWWRGVAYRMSWNEMTMLRGALAIDVHPRNPLRYDGLINATERHGTPMSALQEIRAPHDAAPTRAAGRSARHGRNTGAPSLRHGRPRRRDPVAGRWLED